MRASLFRPWLDRPVLLKTVHQLRQQHLWLLIVVLVISWLPVLLHTHTVPTAAEISEADAVLFYWIPRYGGQVWLAAPVVLSCYLLLLSPGLFLALALGEGRSVGHFLLTGFTLSFLLTSSVTAVYQLLTQTSLQGSTFLLLLVLEALLGLAILLWRIEGVCLPQTPSLSAVAASMLIVPAGLLVAFAPKFFWENFNGDGAHAFESARLLLFQPVPFWPSAAGEIAAFPDITSALFTYPISWFIRLFGPLEVAARLPYLLYLPLLFGLIWDLTTAETSAQASWTGERKYLYGKIILLWLSLLIYTLVMGFHASYDFYFADVALPAGQDTLLVIFYLGLLLNFIKRRPGWAILFLVLTYYSSPAGLLLIGLWLGAVVLIWRPIPWRLLALNLIALLACVLAAVWLPSLLTAAGLPEPGDEYAAEGLLRRFFVLQWSDWRRLLFVLLPTGIFPALSLLVWRRQDAASRTVTVVTGVYFLLFYIQAFVSLHHFTPVMLLPLIVFWRLAWIPPASTQRATLWGGYGIAAAAAFLISLPASSLIHLQASAVGSTIQDRTPGYAEMAPSAFRRAGILHHLFPYSQDPRVPNEQYDGSALVWHYYAQKGKQPEQGINYVLQMSEDPQPPDMALVAQENGASLYVRNRRLWEQHRSAHPPIAIGPPYYISPEVLFRRIPPGDPRVVRIGDLLDKFGVKEQVRRWLQLD